MNDLLKSVSAARLTENAALDLLQEAGVVSDLCLKLADVAESDSAKAIGVLENAPKPGDVSGAYLLHEDGWWRLNAP